MATRRRSRLSDRYYSRGKWRSSKEDRSRSNKRDGGEFVSRLSRRGGRTKTGARMRDNEGVYQERLEKRRKSSQRQYREIKRIADDRRADRKDSVENARAFWMSRANQAEKGFFKDRDNILNLWDQGASSDRSRWDSARASTLQNWGAEKEQAKSRLQGVRSGIGQLFNEITNAPSTVAQQTRQAQDEQLRAAITAQTITGRGVGGGGEQAFRNRQNLLASDLLNTSSSQMLRENQQRMGARQGLLGKQLEASQAETGLALRDAALRKDFAEKDFSYGRRMAETGADLRSNLMSKSAGLLLDIGKTNTATTDTLEKLLDQGVMDALNVGQFMINRQATDDRYEGLLSQNLARERSSALARDKFDWSKDAYEMDREDRQKGYDLLADAFRSQGGGGAGQPVADSSWDGAFGGAMGGAGLGATIGSVVPGVGTLIGAGVGGLLGGIGGYFADDADKYIGQATQAANLGVDLYNRPKAGSGGFNSQSFYQPPSTFGSSASSNYWGL